jgi:cupin fold WbuC family metalloprotein
MKIVTAAVIDALSAEARLTGRRRRNLNLHLHDEARSQRLFNAIEPGSYIRPHRHLEAEKEETLLLVRGRLGVLEFGDDGSVMAAELLAPGEAADIAAGTWHTAISLERGTVFFEAKAGPYRSLSAEELAPWAPADNSPDAAEYLKGLLARVSPAAAGTAAGVEEPSFARNGTPSQLQGINHVVLKVRNLQHSSRFYQEVLGFRPTGERPGMRFFTGGGHPHDLALYEVGEGAPSPPTNAVGLFHFCVTVADEAALAALYRHCRDRGADLQGSVDHVISRSFYLRDPDGLMVEVTCDVPEAEWRHLKNPFAQDRPWRID